MTSLEPSLEPILQTDDLCTSVISRLFSCPRARTRPLFCSHSADGGDGDESTNQAPQVLIRYHPGLLPINLHKPTGISPKPPPVHGPLPGDDEAACLPSPVSVLWTGLLSQ